jgi:hypothetical protein
VVSDPAGVEALDAERLASVAITAERAGLAGWLGYHQTFGRHAFWLRAPPTRTRAEPGRRSVPALPLQDIGGVHAGMGRRDDDLELAGDGVGTLFQAHYLVTPSPAEHDRPHGLQPSSFAS